MKILYNNNAFDDSSKALLLFDIQKLIGCSTNYFCHITVTVVITIFLYYLCANNRIVNGNCDSIHTVATLRQQIEQCRV